MNLRKFITLAGVALLLSSALMAQNNPKPKNSQDGGDGCQGYSVTCVKGSGASCECWHFQTSCGDYFRGDGCATEGIKVRADGRDASPEKPKGVPGFTVGMTAKTLATAE